MRKLSRWQRFEDGSGQATWGADDFLVSLSKSGKCCVIETRPGLPVTIHAIPNNPRAMKASERLAEIAATFAEAAKHAKELGQ